MTNTSHQRRASVGFRILAAFALVLSAILTSISASPATTNAQEALTLVPVVRGLDAPVQVTNAGDGSNRLFVVERPGRIRVVVDGELLETPFLDLADRVHTDDSEQGLLALAFHPDYENNGELFVFYTAIDWANTVERFHVSNDPNRADPASGEIVLALPDREPNHNGGTLVFGPDGMLYISTGDEGGGGDTFENAQSLSSLFGKILRIDIDAGQPYAIPPDNPYVNVTSSRPEIWSYGLRNPWRISFDRLTDDLWVADVGQSTWEEVNYVPAGTGPTRNFGWNAMEGLHCYADECDPGLYTLPVAEYDHDDGCSITGGHVYRGTAYPSLAGRYFFGDYCSGRIWSLTPDGDDWEMTLERDTESWISSFGEDEAGELYVVDLAGVVYQVTTSTTEVPVISNPAIQRTWARTDKPVADLVADRTWMWGPGPITAAIPEPYAESPDGTRTVQYFDKSRMEITHPDAPDDAIWYVTNGLLVVEMIEGYYQTGDTLRDESPDPAEVNIAGDPDDLTAPTYATFSRLAGMEGDCNASTIVLVVHRDGSITDDVAFAVYDVPTAVYVPETNHCIAAPFWEYMNAEGVVYEDGETITAPLFQNPYYATGYPVTEPFWTRVKVGGTVKDVLLQCFERRCLTYTPSNDAGWQVEAGNVGLHYYIWRYGEQP